MYQTHASLALLLVFIQYCYGGYGRFWGFIISKEINYAKTRHSVWSHRQRITATSTHAQLSPQIK